MKNIGIMADVAALCAFSYAAVYDVKGVGDFFAIAFVLLIYKKDLRGYIINFFGGE